MITSHAHTFRQFLFSCALVALLSVVPAFAGVVFDGTPGTAAPPTTLGPFTMTPFGLDNVNPINPFGANTPNTTSVATPALPCGGALTFAPQQDHRRVGVSWAPWGHGYAGDVYYGPGTSVTITLPSGTGAFYLYALPDLTGTYSIQAAANDGTSSGAIPVTNAGNVPGNVARYYGFYASAGCALTTITITNVSGGSSVAVGEFGIACKGTPTNQIAVSDQKAGSVLVYPYYTSNSQTKADTRVTLSNLGLANVGVHVFFLRGSDCQQSDQYICLTKGASISFKASEQDPETTGYIVAVAVDAMGRPISWNHLIGNAFVNTGEVVDTYGAEALAALSPAGTLTSGNAVNTARLMFDSLNYDRAADQFGVEIQSPNDATGQTIVHASLSGNIATATVDSIAQSGTGLLIRGDEKQGSFVRFIGGNCQSINAINATTPRVPTGLGVFLSRGSLGTLTYATNVASVGLLLTPKNNAWSGIRTLHKTRTKDSTLTIPVFMPACDITLPVGTAKI